MGVYRLRIIASFPGHACCKIKSVSGLGTRLRELMGHPKVDTHTQYLQQAEYPFTHKS